MKKTEFFIRALETLFWSFGGEPPPEVIWGANDILEWMENEYRIEFKTKFSEDPMTIADDFNKVIAEIKAHFPESPPIEPPVNI